MDAASKEPHILLGDEGRKFNSGLTSFWGFGEGFESSLAQTAARECFEESLGLFGSEEWIGDAIAHHSLQLTDLHFAICIGTFDVDALQVNFQDRKDWSKEVLEVLRPLVFTGLGIGEPPLQEVVCVPAKEFANALRSGGTPQHIRERELRVPLQLLFYHVQESLKNFGANSRHYKDISHFLAFCNSGSLRMFNYREESQVQSIPASPSRVPSVEQLCSVALYSCCWSGLSGDRKRKQPKHLAADSCSVLRKLFGDNDEWTPRVVPEVVRHWMRRGADSVALGQRCAEFVSRFLRQLFARAPGRRREEVMRLVKMEVSAILEQSVQRFVASVLSQASTTTRESCRVVCGLHFVDRVQEFIGFYDLKASNPGWDMAAEAAVACAAVLKHVMAKHPSRSVFVDGRDGQYCNPFMWTVMEGAVQEIDIQLKRNSFLKQVLQGPYHARDVEQRAARLSDGVPLGCYIVPSR
eukprot:1299236-Rhodomonas_salina.1